MSTSESKKNSSSEHSKKEHPEDKNADEIPIEEVMKKKNFFKIVCAQKHFTLYQSFS